jgi:hypothetical protein
VTAIAAAVIAALGLCLSAYITARLQRVQRTINGHTRALEAKVSELERALGVAYHDRPLARDDPGAGRS